jgi:hypothetical protein
MIETRDIPLEEIAKYYNVGEVVVNGPVATKKGKALATETGSIGTFNVAEKDDIAMMPKESVFIS